MALSQAQRTMIERARAIGAGGQAVALDDGACAYLVAVIADDLGLAHRFPELDGVATELFTPKSLSTLSVRDVTFYPLIERLIAANRDADTYFVCLATLHKARLKYERILQTQAIPTVEQVGPRGLLQFGSLSPKALTPFLFWRKWFYDIDNRAAQETGYLFEPIIASAIGGTPVSAKKSPIRRCTDPRKGRQVDCIRDDHAYEFKIRLTIAASGQGRWQEELDFPKDCRESGYTPVLLVLDATPNPKLLQLEKAFIAQAGDVYLGDSAWSHLDAVAGDTMAVFLEKYVRTPLQALLAEVSQPLPDFCARMDGDSISITVAGEETRIERRGSQAPNDDEDDMPEDVADGLPGL